MGPGAESGIKKSEVVDGGVRRTEKTMKDVRLRKRAQN